MTSITGLRSCEIGSYWSAVKSLFPLLHFSLTLHVHFHSTFKSCSLWFNPTATTTRRATCHSNLISCRRRRRVPVSRFINDCKPAGNKIRTWPAAYSWLHNINNNLSPRAAAAAAAAAT